MAGWIFGLFILGCLWQGAKATQKAANQAGPMPTPIPELNPEEQLERSRQEWATYAATVVQELNRANGMIDYIDEQQKLLKPYVVRKCKHKRNTKK